MPGRVIFCQNWVIWFLSFWAVSEVLVCKPGTERVRLHAALTWPRHRSSPGPPGLVTATGAPQSPGSPAGEEKGKEKGLGLPPPRRALPSPARARTHTAEDRRCPPFATGCELQIKVPVLLGGETAAQAAGGTRGWERGEQRRAASLPSPDDPRPQKSKRAEEKLQLLFPPHHPLSLFSFFFFLKEDQLERDYWFHGKGQEPKIKQSLQVEIDS